MIANKCRMNSNENCSKNSKKRLKRLFMNNEGSTLVIVLVIIAFVAILGSVTVSSAMLNLKMKQINKEAKKSFYTSEEAVDQVYAGLGMECMEALNNCYNKQLSTISRQQIIGGKSYTISLSNEDCNMELRKQFLQKVINDLFSLPNFTETEGVIPIQYASKQKVIVNNLNAYIEENQSLDMDKRKLKVLDVGDCSIVKESSKYANMYNFYILIKDCNIEYKNEKGNYSRVTVDVKLMLPDILFDFVGNSSSKLTTFGEYSLIGCSGIRLKNQKSLDVNSSKAYAGGEGFAVGYQSSLNASGAILVSGNQIDIGKNLKEAGEADTPANQSILNLSTDSQLWCDNIIMEGSVSDSKATINGSAFVKDDLTISGTNNTAEINGNYIGWSYEKLNSGIPSGHANSSGIVVNGVGTRLDCSKIKSLILGGRSYIGLGTRDNEYITGESVSFKAAQEIYLVPDEFITKKSAVDEYYMNPVAQSSQSDVNISIPDTYFAKKNGWLDDTKEYVEIKDNVNNLVYYYFNIKKEYQDDYVERIVNYDSTVENDSYIEKQRNLVKANLGMLMQESLISSVSGSDIYLNGAMINAQVNSGSGLIEASKGTDITSFLGNTSVLDDIDSSISGLNSFEVTNNDLSVRYGLLNSVLYDFDFYQNGNLSGNVSSLDPSLKRYVFTKIPNDVLYNGNSINLGDTTVGVFDYYINKSALQEYINKKSAPFTVNFIDPNEPSAYIGMDDVVIDNDGGTGCLSINKGIIITTGNVTLKNDFDGIIFAKGTVDIADSATVTNSFGSIENMLYKFNNSDRSDIQKFLKAYNVSAGGGSNPEDAEGNYDIGFENLVKFDNWRKY